MGSYSKEPRDSNGDTSLLIPVTMILKHDIYLRRTWFMLRMLFGSISGIMGYDYCSTEYLQLCIFYLPHFRLMYSDFREYPAISANSERFGLLEIILVGA